MSYRIIYGTQVKSSGRAIIQKSKKTVSIALVAAALAVFILMQIPQVRLFFLPGDSQVTVHALDVFMDNLDDGLTFEEAYSEFYKEILKHEP